jgi:hypothetical protein
LRRRPIRRRPRREPQVRGELQVDHTAEPSAQKLRRPVQAVDHDLGVGAAQGLDEADGVLEVWAHPHLGHGDRDPGHRRVLYVLLPQDAGQGVTNQFACAELTL